MRRHASDSGASPAPPAIGTASRSASGLHSGVPGSWVIPGGARACSSDLSLSPPPWVTAPTIAPASTLNGLSFPPERAYVMIENLARVRDRPLGSLGQNLRKFESRSRPPVRRTAQCDGGPLAEEGPYFKYLAAANSPVLTPIAVPTSVEFR